MILKCLTYRDCSCGYHPHSRGYRQNVADRHYRAEKTQQPRQRCETTSPKQPQNAGVNGRFREDLRSNHVCKAEPDCPAAERIKNAAKPSIHNAHRSGDNARQQQYTYGLSRRTRLGCDLLIYRGTECHCSNCSSNKTIHKLTRIKGHGRHDIPDKFSVTAEPGKNEATSIIQESWGQFPERTTRQSPVLLMPPSRRHATRAPWSRGHWLMSTPGVELESMV